MRHLAWRIGAAAAAGFLGCIVLANALTAHYGLVAVGFGLTATAGTYAAGATFILRDTVHDSWGRWGVLALILTGATLSMLVAPARLAIASGTAFCFSELADMAVYLPLRRRGYLPAAIASNVAGAAVDTVLFLAIAGFPIWPAFPGQMVGKLTMTLAAVALVMMGRAFLRQRQLRGDT